MRKWIFQRIKRRSILLKRSVTHYSPSPTPKMSYIVLHPDYTHGKLHTFHKPGHGPRKGDTMSLSAAVTASRKNETTNSSSRNPAWYNRQKGEFIHNMCTHEDPIVRLAALTDRCCPSTRVNAALATELDPTVLRALLMSGRPSIKSIEAFAASDRATMFDDDKEVEDHIVSRIAGAEALAAGDQDADGILDEADED